MTSVQGESVAAIIPALNEAATIVATVTKLQELFLQSAIVYEIVVVDDGSTDGTSELVGALCQDDPRIKLIKHEKTLGLACSYIEAARSTAMKYCIYIPGDDNITQESIKRILDKRGNADLILSYYENLEERTFLRRTVSKAYTRIVNAITGYRLKYYNGNNLYKTEEFIKLEIKTESFGYMADSLLKLLEQGSSYLEVPAQCVFREEGSHAFRIKNMVGVLGFLFQLLIKYRFKSEPVKIRI